VVTKDIFQVKFDFVRSGNVAIENFSVANLTVTKGFKKKIKYL